MLDIESCIALSGLTEEEIKAIAEHKLIPQHFLERYAPQSA